MSGSVFTYATLVVGVTLSLLTSSPQYAHGFLSLSLKDDTRELIELGQFVFGNENSAGPSGGFFSIQLKNFVVSDGSAFLNQDKLVSPLSDPIGIVADRVESTGDATMRLKTAKKRMASEKICYINDDTFKPTGYSDSPDTSTPSSSPSAPDMKQLQQQQQQLPGRYVFPINGLNVDKIAPDADPVTFQVKEAGLYVFYFYNCRGLSAITSTGSDKFINPLGRRLKMPPITASADMKTWNIDSSGYVFYLPGNQQSLPFWYSFFAIVFACGCVTWYRLMRQHSQNVVRLHQGLMILMVVKTLTLTFEALRYSHYKSTGHESMWTILYYGALCIKGILLFSSLVLIGAGWSIVKSSINNQEATLLKLLIPAQMLLNICQIILDETSKGNRSWGIAQDVLLFLDMVCCLAVLLPLFTSMKNLQDVADSQDEKALRVVGQLKMLRSIYFAIVIYLYSSRVMVRLLMSVAPYYVMGWMGPVLNEIIAIVFYVYVGYMLQPTSATMFSPLANGARNEVDTMISSRREIGVLSTREVV